MTIAKRLIFLLAVPLVALVGLGILSRLQLSTIETRSRFVADLQIPGLAALGNISRRFAELRIDLRNYVLAGNEAERSRVGANFDRHEAEITQLFDQYERTLISDDRDRQMLNEYLAQHRDWMGRARSIKALAVAERHDDAAALLRDQAMVDLGERMSAASGEWIRHNEELAYRDSQIALDSVTTSRRRMLAASVAAILLTAFLGFLTFLRIVRPVRALDASVRTIAAGQYDTAVPFTAATDETGGLARSIDILKQGAAAMDEQRWVKANASRLTGALQGALSLAEFGERLLSDLVPTLGGGI
jgi:methyl-accepting chemotaxis protein